MKNNENFDELLSSILNSSTDKKENRDGIITEVPDYSSLVKEKKIEEKIEESDLNNFADKTLIMSEQTNVFSFKEFNDSGELAFEEPLSDEIYEEDGEEVKEDNVVYIPRKKRRRRANYTGYFGLVLATLVVCVSILISLFGIVVGRDTLGIDTGEFEQFSINIPEGSSTSDIANILYKEGVIYYPDVFKAISKLKNADGAMYPGYIDVTLNMSYLDIIDSLMEPRLAKETVTVTFPEGITIYAAAQKLEENGVCDANDFIFEFNSTLYGFEFESHVATSPLRFYRFEGYLFPDTYEFYVGDTPYNVVRKIKSRTNEILSHDLIVRCNESGRSLDDVLVLASIVQLESGNVEDMKNIASVFINRLNNPEIFPRLQSDTSYSYIDNVIKANSDIEFTEMYNAYDTYTCLGLPAGALCNPGLDAINAVLDHNNTEYYYFCSDIETRETFFAVTHDEHLENLKKAGIELD